MSDGSEYITEVGDDIYILYMWERDYDNVFMGVFQSKQRILEYLELDKDTELRYNPIQGIYQVEDEDEVYLIKPETMR